MSYLQLPIVVWGRLPETSFDQRSHKKWNFGIIYGKSGHTFARDLYGHMEQSEALEAGDKLVRDYLKTFKSLAKWITDTQEFARKNGYVETLFGRRRRLPDMKSKDRFLRSEAERQAINAPIQGTGSDLTLLSVIKSVDFLVKEEFKSTCIGTVHDSIIFDVYIPELYQVVTRVKNIMEHVHENYFDTPVPIAADVEVGPSYGEMYDVDNLEAISNFDGFNQWVKECRNSKKKDILDTLINKHEYTPEQIQAYCEKFHTTLELSV